MPDMRSIAEELNSRAATHPIGELQRFRKQFKKLKRSPGMQLFDSKTIKDNFAFHYGGRHELQFNIGFEDIDEERYLRYGVAFSLEPSQALPTEKVHEVLLPKIRRFNEYVSQNPYDYSDMRMWVERGNTKLTPDYMPSPILDNADPGNFIFLGKHDPVEQIDYEVILSTFDRLLPLYSFIEDAASLAPIPDPARPPFVFRAGWRNKPTYAVTTLAQKELDVRLRHNEIQQFLCEQLADKYGAANIGSEIPSGNGMRIDVVVRLNDGYLFYEIKTEQTARMCIREALPQLLEYSFWPRAQVAKRLFIVGEAELDGESEEYLETLKRKFGLPVDYEQITLND
jgi:hypothetical protein